MAANSLLEKLRARLRTFSAAQNGNVVITFALLVVPLIGFVGTAVDYSRANSAKAAMQAAVDATALMLSKDVASLTNAQITQKATGYFNALFNRTEVTNIALTPVYNTSGGAQLILTGTGQVPTTFTKIMGFQQLSINVSSTVKWGNSRLRVALVLDNTGSMATANKMTALKTAAKNLLTQLKDSATQNGDVYVSIIPFSKDVNVDKANYTQPWVRWDLWDAANSGGGGGSGGGGFSGSICLNGQLWQVNGSNWSSGGSCSGQSAGICYQGTLWNWNGSSFVAGGNCSSSSSLHATWNGCVTDRDQDYDTKNTAPSTGTPATLFPAEQYSSCPVPMMGLSYDWTALNAKIDSMQPDGNTNQAIGLQWGFQSLTSAPFTIPPMDANYKYQQVIILLTDGLNTENRFSTSASAIDARQKKTCDNIYAAGITLYAVQVNTDGDPTQAVLQNCAGDPTKPKYPDPSKFFILTSASAIVTAFNQIGTSLSNLRVAR